MSIVIIEVEGLDEIIRRVKAILSPDDPEEELDNLIVDLPTHISDSVSDVIKYHLGMEPIMLDSLLESYDHLLREQLEILLRNALVKFLLSMKELTVIDTNGTIVCHH